MRGVGGLVKPIGIEGDLPNDRSHGSRSAAGARGSAGPRAQALRAGHGLLRPPLGIVLKAFLEPRGYIERAKRRETPLRTLGLGLREQRVEAVPTEEHDELLDGVIFPDCASFAAGVEE